MKSYTVLRNNHESGPHSLDDLQRYGLDASDLIWVEDESKAWKPPHLFEELEPIANAGIKKMLPPSYFFKAATPVYTPQESLLLTDDILPSDKTMAANRKRRSGLVSLGPTIFGLSVLAIGLGLCGVIVVNMARSLNSDVVATAEASNIGNEEILVNSASNTAETVRPIDNKIITSDSIAIDPLQASTPILRVPARLTVKTSISEQNLSKVQANADSLGDAKQETQTPLDVVEEKKKEIIPASAATVSITANDYKVGFLGGVSNLEVTVSNASTQTIAKVLVDVEFLKPNGNIVKTQSVTIENVAAGNTKKVEVPPSNRGVKVRCILKDITVSGE